MAPVQTAVAGTCCTEGCRQTPDRRGRLPVLEMGPGVQTEQERQGWAVGEPQGTRPAAGRRRRGLGFQALADHHPTPAQLSFATYAFSPNPGDLLSPTVSLSQEFRPVGDLCLLHDGASAGRCDCQGLQSSEDSSTHKLQAAGSWLGHLMCLPTQAGLPHSVASPLGKHGGGEGERRERGADAGGS